MNAIRTLFVGAVKADFYKSACAHYTTAIKRFLPLEESLVKDAGSVKDRKKRMAAEGAALLAKTGPKDLLIALDEGGTPFSSRELAKRLQGWIEDPGKRPCFIVGGAYGLSPDALAAARVRLSLGPCTLPHELARVVLLEQLYRALSILRNTPYHH